MGFFRYANGGSARPYFQEFEDWPIHAREAIQRARAPILDTGCGAGRVALYLQSKGSRVLAIDNSPMAGQIRMRSRHRQFRGGWFDYLFVSQREVGLITEETGWRVNDTVESNGPGFVTILEKR